LAAIVARAYQAPDSLRIDMTIPMLAMKTTTIISPEGGWIRQQQGKKNAVQKLNPSELEQFTIQMWRDPDLILLRSLESGVVIGALKDGKVGKKAVHIVRIARKDLRVAVTLFISKKNFMVERMTYLEQGRRVSENFGSYKSFDGIKIARKRDISGTFYFSLNVKDVIMNKTFEKTVFAKP